MIERQGITMEPRALHVDVAVALYLAPPEGEVAPVSFELAGFVSLEPGEPLQAA